MHRSRTEIHLHATHGNCYYNPDLDLYELSDETPCTQPMRQWTQRPIADLPDRDPATEQRTVPLITAPSVTTVLPLPHHRDNAPTDSPLNCWPYSLEHSTTTGDRSRTCKLWPFGRR